MKKSAMLSLVVVSVGIGTGLINSGIAHASQVGIRVSKSNNSSERLMEEISGKLFLEERLMEVENLNSADYTPVTWTYLWDTYKKAKQAYENPLTSDMMLRSWGDSIVHAMNVLQTHTNEADKMPEFTFGITPNDYVLGQKKITGESEGKATLLALYINGVQQWTISDAEGSFIIDFSELGWKSITKKDKLEIAGRDSSGKEMFRKDVSIINSLDIELSADKYVIGDSELFGNYKGSKDNLITVYVNDKATNSIKGGDGKFSIKLIDSYDKPIIKEGDKVELVVQNSTGDELARESVTTGVETNFTLSPYYLGTTQISGNADGKANMLVLLVNGRAICGTTETSGNFVLDFGFSYTKIKSGDQVEVVAWDSGQKELSRQLVVVI